MKTSKNRVGDKEERDSWNRTQRQAKRLQFDMTQGQLQNLDDLVNRTVTIRSRRELINHALSLFKWAVEQRESGRRIGAFDDANPTHWNVLTFPSLEEIQPVKRPELTKTVPGEIHQQ